MAGDGDLLRVVIDTNAFDVLAADDATLREVEAAIVAGQLELVVVNDQAAELSRIPDSDKRARFLSLTTTDQMPVAVWGMTGWGEAVWGDEATAASFADTTLDGASMRHYVDAQILVTAQRLGLPLVTADKRLVTKAAAGGVTVVAADALLQEIRDRA